ncbi:MAG: hypothetical protein Q9187_006231 [Circinaria calcarea]
MSDDEDDYYDDDDDYYYVDEGPVTEADDLVEHTMHSPVWQDNDPSYEMAEGWSDWEYYSDDYYDQESPTRDRQTPGNSGKIKAIGRKRRNSVSEGRQVRKRRKLVQTNNPPQPPAPIVKWKEELSRPESRVVGDYESERVALLKDWRQRFRVASWNSRSRTLTQVAGQNPDTVTAAIEHQCQRLGRPKQGSPTACSTCEPLPTRAKQSLTGSDTSGNSPTRNECPDATGNVRSYSALTRKLGTNEGNGPTDHDGQGRGANHLSGTIKLREFAANILHQAKVPGRKRKSQEDEPTPEPDSVSVQTKPLFIQSTGASLVELTKPVTRQSKRLKRG